MPFRPLLLLVFLGGPALWAAPPRPAATPIAPPSGLQLLWQRNQVARDEAAALTRALIRQPLTARTAAQIALLNNRSLQATLEEIGLSQADLREAGLLRNPSLEGMLRFPDGGGISNLEGSLAQEFLDLLMRPLRRRVAAAQLARTQLHVANETLKLIADTKVAFFEAQAAAQLAARLRLVQETAAASQDLAQRQHEAGNISDLTLAGHRADAQQAQLEVTLAEGERRVKREELNRLMGVWGADADWQAKDELPWPGEIDLDGLEKLALGARPDLAAARQELDSLAQALGLTKRYRYLGSLEIGVSSEREPDRSIVTGPTLRLELPIFNQGQGRIARGEAQLRQAEARLEAVAAEARSEVRLQRERLAAKRRALELYQRQLLPERLRIVQLTLLQYNAMFTGFFELVAAKQREVETERAFIETLRDYWVARCELERAVGGSFTSRAPVSPPPPAGARTVRRQSSFH